MLGGGATYLCRPCYFKTASSALAKIDKNWQKKTCYFHGGGGAGTFLMEHVPKSNQKVGVFLNFRKVPMVLYCHKKERGGTPSNI